MPVVSITRLRIRSLWFLPAFFFYAFVSRRQCLHANGNLSVSVLNDANSTFWTRTMWNDESAMKEFMMSGPHRQAMPKLAKWCDEAAFVHWHQDDASPPGWKEAHRKLLSDGRRSKVLWPSSNHDAFIIPSPRA